MIGTFGNADAGLDEASLRMPCSFEIPDWFSNGGACRVEWEDHNDTVLGHSFVPTEPWPEERDY